MVDLLSEKQNFKWDEPTVKSFGKIKEAIANAPTLIHLDFKKDFIIYCYASEHMMSRVLLQKNEKDEEVPISFMSILLKKHELCYFQTKKQAFVVVKVVKQFWYYILHSYSIVFVLNLVVNSILTQQEVAFNNKATWVAKVQEFDLEIKPTKLVRGQGLCKLMVDNKKIKVCPIVCSLKQMTHGSQTQHYFLLMVYPQVTYQLKEKRNLRLKATKYVIVDNVLHKKGLDGMFLRCIDKDQQQKLLQTFHNEAYGGHYSSSVIAFKILRNCYYWPNMFRDAYKWVVNCEKCKLFSGKPQLVSLPLRPVIIEEPFQQWGLDFIGPINPTSSRRHTLILTATYYFTKWVEVVPVKVTTSEVVYRFLKENIVTIFGVPLKIVADNAQNFSSQKIQLFCYDHGINLSLFRLFSIGKWTGRVHK